MNPSVENTEELFSEYINTRDIELRNKIVRNNLFLAQGLSRKFLGRGIEYDDLCQIASLALIKAVERFDPSFETKFITFATPTIIGEIKKYFRDKVPIIKLPRRLHEIKGKIGEAKSELQSKNRKTPSADDIAKYLGITLEAVLEAMEANLSTLPASIDAGALFDAESDFHETLGADDTNFSLFENKVLVNKIMSELEDHEKEFVEMRFYKEMTQSKIASEMNVSQMYISRFEKKLFDKIRKVIGI